MNRNIEIAALLLVMAAGLYTLELSYDFATDAVFGSGITGRLADDDSGLGSGSAVEKCSEQGNKIVCPSGNPRMEYRLSEIGQCLAECRDAPAPDSGGSSGGSSGSGSQPTTPVCDPSVEVDVYMGIVDVKLEGGKLKTSVQTPVTSDIDCRLRFKVAYFINEQLVDEIRVEVPSPAAAFRHDIDFSHLQNGDNKLKIVADYEHEINDVDRSNNAGEINVNFGGQADSGSGGDSSAKCTEKGSKIVCSLNGREYQLVQIGQCEAECRGSAPPSDDGQNGGSGGQQPGDDSQQVAGGPDLVVELTDFPVRMLKGETYRFTATITNKGDVSTLDAQRPGTDRGFNTVVFMAAPSGQRYATTAVSPRTIRLRPGESLQRIFDWAVPEDAESGVYKFLVTVDPEDEIREVNEGNNRDLDKTVPVNEKPSSFGVDLVVDVLSFIDQDGNAVEELATGGRYTVSMRAENIGEAEFPVSSFITVIYFAEPGRPSGIRMSGRDIGYFDIKDANRFEWSFSWAVPDSVSAGNYEIYAKADTQQRVSEVDELNNEDRFPVRVRKSEGANLAVVSASAVPGANNAFRAEVTIKNTGEKQVFIGSRSQPTQGGGSGSINFLAVEAKIERNSQVVCSGIGYVYEPIAPNGEKQLTISPNNGNCVLERGNYVLDVLVDSNNHIIETEEAADNRVRQPFAFGTGSSLTCPGRVGDEVIVGFRTEDGLYCDASGRLVAQKASGQSCVNSFECRSNFCAAGKCVEESILRKVLCTIISC